MAKYTIDFSLFFPTGYWCHDHQGCVHQIYLQQGSSHRSCWYVALLIFFPMTPGAQLSIKLNWMQIWILIILARMSTLAINLIFACKVKYKFNGFLNVFVSFGGWENVKILYTKLKATFFQCVCWQPSLTLTNFFPYRLFVKSTFFWLQVQLNSCQTTTRYAVECFGWEAEHTSWHQITH